MITQPTCARTIDVIREQLRTVVAPACADPSAAAALGTIDAILSMVAIRCEHEIGWMHEEMAQIEAAAITIIAAGADDSGAVAKALDELRRHRTGSQHGADVRADYDRAGELLSRCLDAGLAAGPELAERARSVLEFRLGPELEVLGAFAVVGR